MMKTELIRKILITTGCPRFCYWYWVVFLSGVGNVLLYSGLPDVLGGVCALITGGAWGAVALRNVDRFTKRPE